jgi:UDP-glucose 4-epimerase
VRDRASLQHRAATAPEPAAAGEIYNVGSTESVSILKLAKRVLRLTGRSSELVFIPYEQVYGHGIEEMFQRMPSIEKIQRAIGWRPQRELDEILADVVVHAPAQQASLDPI